MGTIVVIDVYAVAGPGAADGAAGRPGGEVGRQLAEAVAILHRADATFNTWRPDSPVSQLRRGEITGAQAPAEVAEVLERCAAARDLSGGWFDPWAMPGGFDPSGFVKGWAAQNALAAFRGDGIAGVLVNAAGDIASTGGPGDGRPFRIGIPDPRSPRRLAEIVELAGAIATSGTYERGDHIIDPHSGRPTARAASASVTGPDLGLADALATAVAVAGEPGLALIEELDGYEALIINADGSRRRTTWFPVAAAAPGWLPPNGPRQRRSASPARAAAGTGQQPRPRAVHDPVIVAQHAGRMRMRPARLALVVIVGLTLASCSADSPASPTAAQASGSATAPIPRHTAGARHTVPPVSGHPVPGAPLPRPVALIPFGQPASAGLGAWRAAGRAAGGVPTVYETTLVPPGGTQPAGIAWMNMGLLSARLYSGSLSTPGGGPYRYTASVALAQARTLVAAFNGGFQMNTARGGYYTERRTIYPLRTGAASLVIYADGTVDIGAWGRDVTMTRQVVSVRQNLKPLVAGGRPTRLAATKHWLQEWGDTCSATSCGQGLPGVEHQWRTGLGITADGALVYVAGPALDPLQLAQLLVRAGVVRGMEFDINPYWPFFVTYDPPAGAPAAPSNGSKLLASTVQGPSTVFEASWDRDFITMSARPAR